MPSKPAVFSKLNWLGIVLLLAGLDKFAASSPIPIPDSWMPYVLAVSGIAAIVLRTFFTTTTIQGVTK